MVKNPGADTGDTDSNPDPGGTPRPQPLSVGWRARKLQPRRPGALERVLGNKRSRHDEKPLSATREGLMQQQRPRTAKNTHTKLLTNGRCKNAQNTASGKIKMNPSVPHSPNQKPPIKLEATQTFMNRAVEEHLYSGILFYNKKE